MANVTHKLQFTTSSSTGIQSLSGSDSEASNTNSELYGSFAFPANSTNAAFTLACNAAKLQDVTILANQNCTINTVGSNSTMLTLIAGLPFVWGVSMPAGSPYPTNPFTGTVNSATITCNTATQLKYILGSA